MGNENCAVGVGVPADSLKLARDGHLGFGPKPPPFGFLRPVWDRLVVQEWDAEGNPIRWYEEIMGRGAIGFSGILRGEPWIARIVVTPTGIERTHRPPVEQPK